MDEINTNNISVLLNFVNFDDIIDTAKELNKADLDLLADNEIASLVKTSVKEWSGKTNEF